jgi:hypothetical protein
MDEVIAGLTRRRDPLEGDYRALFQDRIDIVESWKEVVKCTGKSQPLTCEKVAKSLRA